MLSNLRRLSAAYLKSAQLLPDGTPESRYLHGIAEGIDLAIESLEEEEEETTPIEEHIYMLQVENMMVASYSPIHCNSRYTGIGDSRDEALVNLFKRRYSILIQEKYAIEPE